MRFNVTKGQSTEYLAGVFLFDTNKTYSEANLFPAQKVELSSKNKTDFFLVVIYPISSTVGDFFIKTTWVDGFPWWGIFLIILLILFVIIIVIVIILVILIALGVICKKKKGSSNNKRGFSSVDDVRSEDGRDVPAGKSGNKGTKF